MTIEAILGMGFRPSGLPVQVTEHATRQRWIPPDPDGLWTFGPEDEEWCRFFGVGRVVTEPASYIFSGGQEKTLVIHPDLWAKMKEQPEIALQ